MAEAQEASYKQLSCPICLETFESPKVLACLHTFCEKCIRKHVSSLREAGAQSDTITCPVCRSPIPAPASNQTPADWVAKLPINSIVVSNLASTQSKKDNHVYCEPCLTLGKQHISVAFCVTCSEYLCNTCYTSHKSFKMSKDHSTTALPQPVQQNWNSTQDEMYSCSIHWEQYTYFCTNHQEFCCSHCAIKDHRKCDELLIIKDLSKDAKEGQDLKHISDNLDGVKKMFITLLESRSKNLESIEQQRAEITKSIKEWTVIVKQCIDRLETAALEELDQMCKQETVTLSDEITECKSAIAAIQTSEQILMDATKSDDGTKVFITMMKVSQHVLKYKEKYDTKENKSEVVELEFHCDRTCEGILETLNSLGQMFRTACKITKISFDSSCARTENLPLKIQPNSMVTIDAKIPGDDQTCAIYSGVFLPDDRLVLSDGANNKLKLFEKSFWCISSLKLIGGYPHVCRVDHNTVAVSLGTNINLLSVGNTLTPLRSISVGDSCFGIASYQQNIIVHIGGDGKRDSFFRYDASGKRKQIKPCDNLQGVFNEHCVSQDGQKIYYIKQNRIVSMDMMGEQFKTFESRDLKGTTGITVDKNGIIYCCGYWSNTVVQVTPEGRQLCVLLSHDHGLSNPRGVCLNDTSNRILVFEANTDKVKVFKLM